jgi:hypothetical protein
VIWIVLFLLFFLYREHLFRLQKKKLQVVIDTFPNWIPVNAIILFYKIERVGHSSRYFEIRYKYKVNDTFFENSSMVASHLWGKPRFVKNFPMEIVYRNIDQQIDPLPEIEKYFSSGKTIWIYFNPEKQINPLCSLGKNQETVTSS